MPDPHGDKADDEEVMETATPGAVVSGFHPQQDILSGAETPLQQQLPHPVLDV